MYGLYRNITRLVAPLLPYWLERRQRRGKEHPQRMQERFGKATLKRPEGKLLWVHAASVGESNAALPLIKAFVDANPALNVLMTTGTVTSAALVAKRLPPRTVHQFAPVDAPKAVDAFIEHWRPQMGLFVDSELWPNLVIKARARGTILALVNARMSEASFRKWKYARSLIGLCLHKFSFCFAQSSDSAEYLTKLGMDKIDHIGNLKYDVPPLPCDEAELSKLRRQIGDRPVWLAASTHPGEEAVVADVHRELQSKFPNLLTIIVPRHAERGEDIAKDISGLSIARRSLGAPIFEETDIYIADTMGELGLFYRLSQAAFIGGSLVPHGGQNPIEAMQLGCPVILGPHMENFRTITRNIERAEACSRILHGKMLAGAVARFLSDEGARRKVAEAGQKHIKASAGTLVAIVNKLQPSLAI